MIIIIIHHHHEQPANYPLHDKVSSTYVTNKTLPYRTNPRRIDKRITIIVFNQFFILKTNKKHNTNSNKTCINSHVSFRQ